jgi:hypothetical protein
LGLGTEDGLRIISHHSNAFSSLSSELITAWSALESKLASQSHDARTAAHELAGSIVAAWVATRSAE